MLEHQERVVVEKTELVIKKQALSDFMHTKVYGDLPSVEQGLLMVQLVAMQNYIDVLVRRIEIFR